MLQPVLNLLNAGGPLLGGGPGIKFLYDPENTGALPDTATFARASLMEVLTTTDGTLLWYQGAKSGELPLDGLRRVEQLISTDESNLTLPPWGNDAPAAPTLTAGVGTDPFGGSDTTEIVFAAQFENVRQFVSTEAGADYAISFYLKRTAGTTDVQVYYTGSATGTSEVISVTSDWQRFSFIVLGNSLSSTIAVGLQDRSSSPDSTVLVHHFQVEKVQQSSDVASELVKTATTYNADVAGVKYFNTVNANSIDGSNVVTEATGATITGGGYLPEPAATNHVLESSDIADAAWTKTNLSAATQTAGGIGLAGNTLDAGVAAGVAHTATAVVPATATRTAYAIAKAGTGQFLTVRTSATADEYAVFDLTGGTVPETGAGATSRITDLTGGWYKCEVTSTVGTGLAMLLGISDTGTPGQADPSFNGANETILVHHVQWEGSTTFSTPPIITAGVAATRAANTLTTGVNADAATSFLVDATAPVVAGSTAPSLAAVDGSSDDRVALINDTSIISEADVQATITNDIRGERHKIAASWEQVSSGLIVVDDESNSATGTPTAAPWDGADMTLGYGGSTQYWRGRIHKFVQYGDSQTQAALEALTS